MKDVEVKEAGTVSPIIEVSKVIQGEGRFAGTLSILVRFSGCPLRCMFGGNICDTSYASWQPEKGTYSIMDVRSMLVSNPHIKHMILTGGEPLLYKSHVKTLIDIANVLCLTVTIETSGAVDYDFSDHDFHRVDDGSKVFLSISPKLSNSVPTAGDGVSDGDICRHNEMRKNYYGMIKMIKSLQLRFGDDYQVKFVIKEASDVHEAESVRKKLLVPKDRVFLMPEGLTKEEIDIKREWIMTVCVDWGYNYSDRLHILAYGNRRGV